MTTRSPRHIEEILVPIAISEEAAGGVLVARDLGRRLNARLHWIHVAKPVSAHDEHAAPGLGAARRSHVAEELAGFAKAHGIDAPVTIRDGESADQILRAAHETGADLIVLGRYGRGGPKPLGSVAEGVIRHSPVSVLVVRPEFRGAISRIGVAVDLSGDAAPAVSRAIELAGKLGQSEVVLFTVFTVPSGYHMVCSWEDACTRMEALARRRGEELRARLAPGGPRLRVVAAEGAPESRIPELARREGVDLLVLGAHERTPAALLLLGRTTEKIVRSATCNVWCERTPELAQSFADAVRELIR